MEKNLLRGHWVDFDLPRSAEEVPVSLGVTGFMKRHWSPEEALVS